MKDSLTILYQDHWYVAIDKPSGADVHRNAYNRHRPILLQMLRNQLNKEVHPVHRLDGGTSGVLLFALDRETLALTSQEFSESRTEKTYIAITRGFAKDCLCEKPLRVHEKTVEAVTEFRCLGHMEKPWPNEVFPTSRYSLVEAKPKTGRYHQIRRHLRDLSWPVIGDTKHGDSFHNELWKKHLQNDRLLLHATKLTFKHVHLETMESIESLLPSHFSFFEYV